MKYKTVDSAFPICHSYDELIRLNPSSLHVCFAESLFCQQASGNLCLNSGSGGIKPLVIDAFVSAT